MIGECYRTMNLCGKKNATEGWREGPERDLESGEEDEEDAAEG
jgi:hypothetical protein